MRKIKAPAVVLAAIVGSYVALPSPGFAAFEEWNVPIAVKSLYCDGAPRIVVQFADASKNIWYPANAGESSRAFLATAMAAKISGTRLYYYGGGDPAALTTYCINVSARPVYMFGLH